MNIKNRGLLFVLSSPSGAGKTTIAKSLISSDPRVKMSVSVTTRPQRPGEIDGVDYHFKSEKEYDALLENDALLEHAQVFGNHYGTLRKPVEDMLEDGHDIIFDIDWQGTQQIAEKCRPDMVRVFILPPSTTILEHRLRSRGTDSDDIITQRMNQALNEISHWPEYDYVIVNSDIEDCILKVRSILASERLKRSRQVGLVDFVNTLRYENRNT